ncbi:hypothetical protein [Dyadobacter flavalbus]|uniref:hypothetical protein n=1 Tax=Dyadobacter flavalbus TaxID=2579942 RepID=UPI001376324F|nr:hypothetical protein [Dyadobacter flavalbus]
MKKPTVDQIAKTIYQTMPLARRSQVMETAESIHALYGTEKTSRKIKSSVQ